VLEGSLRVDPSEASFGWLPCRQHLDCFLVEADSGKVAQHLSELELIQKSQRACRSSDLWLISKH